MREPDLEIDSWCLDDGEACHAASPDRFAIPDVQRRSGLQPGDLAKLIFRISVDSPDEPVAVERMWVIVRERTDSGYFGILDNDPYFIAANEDLWRGIELPFSARHVIDISPASDDSVELAQPQPTRQWPRD